MQTTIFAAGMGKRLGEYAKNNAMRMVPVHGTHLIDCALEQNFRQGDFRMDGE